MSKTRPKSVKCPELADGQKLSQTLDQTQENCFDKIHAASNRGAGTENRLKSKSDSTTSAAGSCYNVAMSAKTSINYYRPPNKHSATIRRVISVLVVGALLVVVAGAASFTAANQLMRQEPSQLQSFPAMSCRAFR